MASDDAALARLFFYDNPEYKRHPNYTKTDQLPISEVITGLPRPYHHTMLPYHSRRDRKVETLLRYNVRGYASNTVLSRYAIVPPVLTLC